MFRHIPPFPGIESFVEYCWIIEDDDTTPVCQKIIPDAFIEIIIHYGDPFKILLTSEWEHQLVISR